MIKCKLFILTVLSIFFISCNNTTNEAIKYNDLIISKQQKIVTLFNKLDSSFVDTINKTYIQNYETLKKEIEQQLSFIDSLHPFNGSNSFKDEYKLLLESYNEALKNEYQKMIEWNALPNDQFTQEVSNKFYQTYNNVNKKIENAINRFIDFQKSFAEEYKFNLIEHSSDEY